MSLEEIHQLLGKKINETEAQNKAMPGTDLYVLLHSGEKAGMQAQVEYWTSIGASANGVDPKTILKCITNKISAELETESIQLITPTTGGRDALDVTERLDALKSTLLRRGRIVTRADVETYCHEIIGKKQLQKVEVKEGVGTDPRFNFGMSRFTDVWLTPSKEHLKEDWSATCEQMQTLLEKQSSSNVPFRVRLST